MADDEIPDRAVVRGPNDDPALSDAELIARRQAWFAGYLRQRNVCAPSDGGPYTCPCCGHPTLDDRGGYDICHECGWEDDGQDEHDSGVVRGGPNGPISLDEARAEYLAGGGIAGNHLPPNPPR